MKSISPLLNIPSTFILFLASPGWGKTTGLIEILKNNNYNLIYLSPLNAINNEVFGRFANQFQTYISKGDLNKIYSDFLSKQKSVLISTPESLNVDLIEKNQSKESNVIFVLDEFHLFYYWSNTFRPVLLDKLIRISLLQKPILALTATMDKLVEQEWKSGFINQYENLIKIDIGNQELLNYPRDFFSFTFLGAQLIKKKLIRVLFNIQKSNDKVLVFCRYRKEVEWWIDFCFKKNIWCLGCVGGHTDYFLNNLKQYPETKIIFSTCALGHGVNLPSFKSIWILDDIKNKDFLLQMVARAGRRNEKYYLYFRGRKYKNLFMQIAHSIKLYLKFSLGINFEK